jgi:hypothetical protein
MARCKKLNDSHKAVARHLAFLAQSPAYKGHQIITWRACGATLAVAAEDLSDMGFMGVEKGHFGREVVVDIAVKRERIARLTAWVEQASAKVVGV